MLQDGKGTVKNGPEELDICFNCGSEKFFARLPKAIQSAMCGEQRRIHDAVLLAFPAALGTSGFRDPEYNYCIGGKRSSKHLYGCARDYLRPGFPRSIPGLVVIFESDHVHVEGAEL